MSQAKIAHALQAMVLENAKSVEMIAEEAFGTDDAGKPRKSKWTLYREVNPEDSGAKVGVLDLVPLMRACGSLEPLQLIANEMGCRVVCIKDAEPLTPGAAFKELADVASKIGKVADRLREFMADGKLDAQECTALLAACIEAHEELEDLTAGAAAGTK